MEKSCVEFRRMEEHSIIKTICTMELKKNVLKMIVLRNLKK